MILERVLDDIFDVYCGPRRLPVCVRRDRAADGGPTYSVRRRATADGPPAAELAGGFASRIGALRWIEENVP